MAGMATAPDRVSGATDTPRQPRHTRAMSGMPDQEAAGAVLPPARPDRVSIRSHASRRADDHPICLRAKRRAARVGPDGLGSGISWAVGAAACRGRKAS